MAEAADHGASTSPAPSGITDANSPSPHLAPLVEEDALRNPSADPSSPKQAGIAVSDVKTGEETRSTIGLNPYVNPSSPKQAGTVVSDAKTDEEKRSAIGLNPSANPSSPKQAGTAVSDAKTDEEIRSAIGLNPNLTDPIPSAPLLWADLVRRTPTASHEPGVVWKLATVPFRAIAGGVGVLLERLGIWKLAWLPYYPIACGRGVVQSTRRLGAWAVVRALSLLGLAQSTDDVGAKAALLPEDIILDIASRLIPSRRDMLAMRATCPEWRAAIPNTNGPLLMMCRLDQLLPKGTHKFIALQVLAGAGGELVMVKVPCGCMPQPPANTVLWGAACGVLALQEEGSQVLFLFCPSCGGTASLPPLPNGMTTGTIPDALRIGGIYFDHPGVLFDTYSILSRTHQTHQAHPKLHEVSVNVEFEVIWGTYQGTRRLPMRSVNFGTDLLFVGVSDGMVTIEVRSGRPGRHVFFLDLDIASVADQGMVDWGNYGQHAFLCGGKMFVCFMLRSQFDANVVNAAVFSVERDQSGRFSLSRTYEIGNFAVFLGGNQSLVLPGEENSIMQRGNTIYIPDDNGLIRNERVWSINVASGETFAIPFTSNVSVNDYGRGFWITLPPLNAQVKCRNCGTRRRR